MVAGPPLKRLPLSVSADCMFIFSFLFTLTLINISNSGHFALMWAKALGAEVYAFSHSASKKDDALKLGADHFIDTSKAGFSEPLAGEIDLIISTASNVNSLPLSEFLSTLSVHGRLVYVGMPEDNLPQVTAQKLSSNGCFIGSSHIGSKKEVLQMLQLAADKGIKTWKNVIPMKNAADGIMAVEKNTIRFRTVLQQGE
jgi:alcohol dehydrogenase (NADP+)